MAKKVTATSKADPAQESPEPLENTAVNGVTLEPESLAINVGDREQLTATIAPEDATDKTVSYSSSANGVALVNETGQVTGITDGSATITVTTTDGSFTDTCDVTVAAVDLPIVDLSLLMPENWPSNSVLKKSTVYLALDDITLEADQTGKLVQTPEGFVFERVDLAVIEPLEMDLSLKLSTNTHPLAEFTVTAASDNAVRIEVTGGKIAGDYLPETWINLVNTGDALPEGAGRLALSIIGYCIEPWR